MISPVKGIPLALPEVSGTGPPAGQFAETLLAAARDRGWADPPDSLDV